MWIVPLAAGLLALTAAAGCGGEEVSTCEYLGQRYVVGDRFPAGDGCNQCECTTTGVACTEIACFDGGVDVDADPASCQPSDGCAAGPTCGGVCCDRGERCVEGACRCGTGEACAPGDSCEAAGPVGGDGCGAVCCGESGPCPQ